MEEARTISWSDFEKVEMRVGTIIDAKTFEEARQPAYKLRIDFGEDIGVKKSSAQLTKRYSPASLIGQQIVAVVNFPPKQIATLMSECLVLGAVGPDNDITLLQPQAEIENGQRIG